MPNNRELNGARQSEARRTNVLCDDEIVSRETIVSKSVGADADSNHYSAHNKAKTDNRKQISAQRHEFNKQRELERIRRRGGMYSAQKVKKSDCADDGQDLQVTQQEAAQAPTSPTFGELYKRFRENKLSRLESWFNAAYIYCNDKYYSSGAPVKEKYRNIYAHPKMWYQNASLLWNRNRWSFAVGLLEIVPKVKRIGHGILHAVTRAERRMRRLWSCFEYSHVAVRTIGGFIKHAAIYTAAAASVALCVTSLHNQMKCVPLLEVYVDGQYAGNAASIMEVEAAQSRFEETVSLNLGTTFRLDADVTYKPTAAKPVKKDDGQTKITSAMSEAFEKAASAEMQQGYGLYVDGALVCAVPYRAWLDSAVSDSLENKKRALEASGVDVSNVTYYNNMTISAGSFPKDVFKSLSDIRELFGLAPISNTDLEYFESQSKLLRQRTAPDKTAAEVSELAVSESKDSAATATLVTDVLEADLQQRTADDSSKTLDVVVERIETVTEEIPYKTVYENDSELVEGRSKTVVSGKPGTREVTYRLGFVGQQQVMREELSSTVISAAVDEVIRVGTRPMSEEEKRVASKGYYIWPCPNDTISSGYGWRLNGSSNEFHKGLDICGKLGTDIVAADGGEVTFAGYDTSGYGECVLIKHDDGTLTRYAHCSALYVTVGQKVAQGETIAAMGQTGVATGVHVHFEIISGGKTQNPYDYLN